MTEYNIYCDESCYLEHDRQPIMVIGGIWCNRRHNDIATTEEIQIK